MPRSYHNKSQFFRKMKKKPALQEIIDNIMTYTEEQLQNIDGQPLWIRDELVAMRKNDGQYRLNPDEIADRMTVGKGDPLRDTRKYEVRRWDTADGVFEYGNKDMSIEVSTGDLFLLFPDDNEAKLNHSVIGVNEFQMYPLFLNTAMVGYHTIDEFRELVRAVLATR